MNLYQISGIHIINLDAMTQAVRGEDGSVSIDLMDGRSINLYDSEARHFWQHLQRERQPTAIVRVEPINAE
jgi:hypothetical protein